MTADAPNPADLPPAEWEAYLRRRQAEREAELPPCFRDLDTLKTPTTGVTVTPVIPVEILWRREP